MHDPDLQRLFDAATHAPDADQDAFVSRTMAKVNATPQRRDRWRTLLVVLAAVLLAALVPLVGDALRDSTVASQSLDLDRVLSMPLTWLVVAMPLLVRAILSGASVNSRA